MRTTLAFLSAAVVCLAQTAPEVINGKLETRALNGTLAATYQSLEKSAGAPLWMAYSVPSIPGEHASCDNNQQHNRTVRLEGPDTLVVLYRFENHTLDRVRLENPDCQFDAGGLPFIFLTGVPPTQSVELLAGLVHKWNDSGERKPHFETMLAALALHRDPAVDRELDSMVAASEPANLRERALFWEAQARGPHGFEIVKNILAHDADNRLREKATFDITLSKEAGVIPALEQAALKDATPKVRRQALFWLSHKAGKSAAQFIVNATKQDPDREVRRQAVFALSQIPNGEGTPFLIQVAKTSTDPEVKKQAVFWLGQSHDQRATTFFQDILAK